MNQPSSRTGTLLFFTSIVAVLVIFTMMFGARLGFWPPIVGFGYIRNYLNPIAYTLFSFSVLGLIYNLKNKNRKGILKTVFATFIGLALLSPTLYSLVKPKKRAPAIHDITTNTLNPPLFLVLDDSRPGAKNSLVYSGEETAKIQQQAYPDIAPILTNLSSIESFNKALKIAKDKGWDIVIEDPKNLRFEATAKTKIFAFEDDIVVVITPLIRQSRIDIRSVSRVGRSDQGANAARIKDFITTFNL
ncbi:DUF1499 domain-containing protein [Pseudoalteromonas sp. MMG010]|uniref:DUF1499 domain-containing protein n=1 Tax=Pseudoalteromonas sp. MMG010 TaxID=2822685 RepID=UPI001B3A20B1|nr:DUF1499 domain-containing protein [Pseudoalteromonas sp. MMG010]MBQ4832072.1 DUF1499 domain-containing protein [Pseudoalteromonas sp. MMG010]